MSKANVKIEFPSMGKTYCREVYGVYQYGVYPRHSVLAGQTRRQLLGQYDTLEEAQRNHPEAEVSGRIGYVEPSLSHLPDGPDLTN